MTTRLVQFIINSKEESTQGLEEFQKLLQEGWSIVNLQSFPFQTVDSILTQAILVRNESAQQQVSETVVYAQAAENLSKMETFGSQQKDLWSMF